MNAGKRRKRTKGSPEEIDKLVISQADDDAAWEQPVRVKRVRVASLSIPGDLAARAAFLAKLHREGRLEEWLARIIRERVELEEAAFVDAKRELATKAGD